MSDDIAVQSGGTAFAIAADYPAGWSTLGRNASSSNNKTALALEDAARGAILTYDLSATTDAGDELFLNVIQWVEEGPTLPLFSLDENGVTVLCSEADVGDTGEINGTIYTKRDRAGLDSLVANDENDPRFATSCTSGIQDMSELFNQKEAFDQDISSWDVSSTTNMRGMFAGASSFDQDIGKWDVSQVEDFSSFLQGGKLSSPNYDALLLGWTELDLLPDLRFDAGGSRYTEAAAGARQSIIDTFGWTISDGGQTTPAITISPEPLDFGDVEIGDSTDQTLMVENTGDALLEGAFASTEVPGFTVEDVGTFALDPGNALELIVTFAPSRGGGFSGSLTIEHNAVNTDSPVEVQLIARGTVAAEIPISTTRAFGDPSVETSYRLVGLPGQIDSDLAATLSGEAGSTWRAFRETGAEGDNPEAYLDEYDGSEAFRFAPGRGFWLLSREEWAVDETTDAVELTDNGLTTVPLQDGWNIFSNPLDQPVAWDETLALEANSSLTEALWQWDGSWQSADTLLSARTGEAYYLFNDGDLEALTLQHPAFSEDEEEDLIAATREERAELHLIAETRSAATEERQEAARLTLGHTASDAVMHRLPPAHFAAAQLAARSGEVDAPLGRLLEVTPEQGDGLTFDVELKGVAEGEAAYFYAKDLDGFEGDEIVLVSVATGARHDLRAHSADDPVRIRIEEGHLTGGSDEEDGLLPLQLLIGDQSFVDEAAERPAALTLGPVYPNPSGGEVTIEVAVPEAMNVRVELFNVLGQQVGLLHSGELDAGVHQLQWDGRTPSAAEAASGVYLVRLLGPDGVQHTGRLTRVR
jgi:surface protein